MYRTIGIIALIAIVAAGAVAALVVYNRGKLGPEEVTARFYREWINTKTKGDPMEKGLHRESTYVASVLGTSLTEQAAHAAGFDPVICSSKKPQGFRVIPPSSPVTASSTRVRVDVETMYESGLKETIEVFLKKDGSWWRIDEIDCPAITI